MAWAIFHGNKPRYFADEQRAERAAERTGTTYTLITEVKMTAETDKLAGVLKDGLAQFQKKVSDTADFLMQQFKDGEPWGYSSASSVDGGHSVVTGGYGAPGAGSVGGDERFITWAQETSFTDQFWKHEVEEAWVVIWPEHLASKEFLVCRCLSRPLLRLVRCEEFRSGEWV